MNGERRAMASVFQTGDPSAFSVAETQGEIMDALNDARANGQDFICLTLANSAQGAKWNGRPVYLSTTPGAISAVAPPMNDADDED